MVSCLFSAPPPPEELLENLSANIEKMAGRQGGDASNSFSFPFHIECRGGLLFFINVERPETVLGMEMIFILCPPLGYAEL